MQTEDADNISRSNWPVVILDRTAGREPGFLKNLRDFPLSALAFVSRSIAAF
jgi:hypothetical protein